MTSRMMRVAVFVATVPMLILGVYLIAGVAIIAAVDLTDNLVTLVTWTRNIQKAGGIKVGVGILIVTAISLAIVACSALLERWPFGRTKKVKEMMGPGDVHLPNQDTQPSKEKVVEASNLQASSAPLPNEARPSNSSPVPVQPADLKKALDPMQGQKPKVWINGPSGKILVEFDHHEDLLDFEMQNSFRVDTIGPKVRVAHEGVEQLIDFRKIRGIFPTTHTIKNMEVRTTGVRLHCGANLYLVGVWWQDVTNAIDKAEKFKD